VGINEGMVVAGGFSFHVQHRVELFVCDAFYPVGEFVMESLTEAVTWSSTFNPQAFNVQHSAGLAHRR